MDYRPGQVSEILEIPPSTLRRYVSQFPEHLSEIATKKRGRKYTERDLIILENIRVLLGRGLSPEQVNEQLPVIGDEKLSEDRQLVPMAEIQKWMDQMSEIALNLRDEIEVLQTKNESLESRLEHLEKPWWKKLRRKEE